MTDSSAQGTKTDNELIADFMGLKISKGVLGDSRIYYEVSDSVISTISDFKYHSSWDWLMPVVQKINQLKPKNDFFYGQFVLKANIEKVYKSVVEFIKWYNSHGK